MSVVDVVGVWLPCVHDCISYMCVCVCVCVCLYVTDTVYCIKCVCIPLCFALCVTVCAHVIIIYIITL